MNLYGKKDHLMAKVTMPKIDYDAAKNRVQPNLDIDAGPKVTIKAIEAKVSKGKLKKYVPVYQQHRVDRDLLVQGATNLTDYFQLQGYYDVDVAFRGEDKVVNGETTIKGTRYPVYSKLQFTPLPEVQISPGRRSMGAMPSGFTVGCGGT